MYWRQSSQNCTRISYPCRCTILLLSKVKIVNIFIFIIIFYCKYYFLVLSLSIHKHTYTHTCLFKLYRLYNWWIYMQVGRVLITIGGLRWHARLSRWWRRKRLRLCTQWSKYWMSHGSPHIHTLVSFTINMHSLSICTITSSTIV